MGGRFAWSESKARLNVEKHGVTFEEASTVFDDALACVFYDERHSVDEHREIIIGVSKAGRLLLASFVEDIEGRIRLISARRATPQEREDYEER